jgi:hypothetical protein
VANVVEGAQVFARRILPAIAAATAMLLVGCALPDGVDGDLTGGWGAVPEPVVFQPEPGTCHRESFTSTGAMSKYDPVPCDQRHVLETVHVGRFGDEVAGRSLPPPEGGPELREAYRECDAAAADYLGADFRHGRLWLGVVRPNQYAWDGGARWFRCDLGVWGDLESMAFLVGHEGSLRGALEGDSDLALGCFSEVIVEDIEVMQPVSCDEPHNTEFVGVWTAPDTSYVDFDVADDNNRIHRGCRSAVAEYVEVPDDADLRFRAGTITYVIEESDWDAGDRGFRCFLWLEEREVSESLEDAGTRGLPVT